MPEDKVDDIIIAQERAALDRWITGDPDGYLALYVTDVTYFDPFREKRVDGLEAMQALVAPMRGVKLPFTEPRYEMIDPKVQRYGEVALLTFNVVSYAKPPGRPETAVARWNATELYRQIDGTWKILHSHWSFVKPDVKQPAF
jgi:uncharacterized protein (TIGR02246 family)